MVTIALTLRPLSNISSAFGPLTVQCTAIFSFLLIPNDLTVYLAFEKTGCCPVSCSKTYKSINQYIFELHFYIYLQLAMCYIYTGTQIGVFFAQTFNFKNIM